MVNTGSYGYIVRDISNFSLLFEQKDTLSSFALHAIVGKIGLAVQLGHINMRQADKLIDRLFKEYGKL